MLHKALHPVRSSVRRVPTTKSESHGNFKCCGGMILDKSKLWGRKLSKVEVKRSKVKVTENEKIVYSLSGSIYNKPRPNIVFRPHSNYIVKYISSAKMQSFSILVCPSKYGVGGLSVTYLSFTRKWDVIAVESVG